MALRPAPGSPGGPDPDLYWQVRLSQLVVEMYSALKIGEGEPRADEFWEAYSDLLLAEPPF